ncbi:hypothetical protein C8J56DRAFT_141799 [Mycena floridula]|nr:hypothetical protein C8J56DRAFT_141799 [Mycena floridula]
MDQSNSACLSEEQRNVSIFLGLHAAGLVLLTAVFLTALLSSSIYRMSTWFMFIFSYMFYCTSYLLLGGHNCDSIPPATLCNIQGGLVYAAPVLASFSTLSYVLEIFAGLMKHIRHTKVPPTYIVWLRTVPYVVSAVVLFEALLVALVHEVTPNSDHMYCHITSKIPSTVTAIVIVFPLLGVVILQGLIAVMLSKHWTSFRKLSKRAPDLLSFSALLRIGGFSILMPAIVTILIVASSVESARHPNSSSHSPGWDFVVPTLPLIAALVFGTQKDMLKVWTLQRVPKVVAFVPQESGQGPLKGSSV